MNNENYETSDLGLASFLFASGIILLGLDRANPQRTLFLFKPPPSELLAAYQSATAEVNAVAHYKAIQDLKARLRRDND